MSKQINISIGSFDVDVKKLAAHETPEYIAQRFQEELQRTLFKIAQSNTATNALFTNKSQLGTSTETRSMPFSFNSESSSPVAKGNATKSSSGSVKALPALSGVNNSSIDQRKSESTITAPTLSGTSTSNDNVSQTASNTNTGVSNQELIQAIENKYLDPVSVTYDETKVEYWQGIVEQIEKGVDPKALILAAEHIELKEFYQEVITKKKPVKILDKATLRANMIQEIEQRYLGNKTLEKEKKTYWEIILAKLKNAAHTLEDILNQHQELFMFMDLLLPKFDTFSDVLKTIATGAVFAKFRKIYPSIGQSDIYVNLGKLKDAKGAGVSLVTKDKEGLLQLIKTPITFTANTNDANINWKIYTKDGTLINTYIDRGPQLIETFVSHGEYVVEAYGYLAEYEGESAQYTAAKSGKKSYIAVHIKEEIHDIKILGGATVIRPGESLTFAPVSDFALEDIPTVAWKYTYKKSKKEPFGEAQLITAIPNDKKEINWTFTEKGTYQIIASIQTGNHEHTVTKEFAVGNNWVTSIHETQGKTNILLNTNQSFQFKVNQFRINPPTEEEKGSVKWVILKNGKLYEPAGYKLQTDQEGKKYFAKGDCFDVTINEEGSFGVEAYVGSWSGTGNDFKEIEIIHPKVIDPVWTDEKGNKKTLTGLGGSKNYINATIPNYENQHIGIHFYAGSKRITSEPFKTKTDKNGKINYEISFTEAYKKQLFLEQKEEVELRFELHGIAAEKPYTFKKPTFDSNLTKIKVSTKDQIIDAYFIWNGKRVSEKDKVPYGEKVKAVVETVNMVGKKVSINIYRKTSLLDTPIDDNNAIVNSNGKAYREFVLKVDWYESSLFGKDEFYIGTEEVHGINFFRGDKYFENNALIATGAKEMSNDIGVSVLLKEEDPQLLWGNRVSKIFRQRVVKICANIEKKKGVKFLPNVLMNIIAFETAATFSPKAGTFVKNQKKSKYKNKTDAEIPGYVGLIQFGPDAAKDLLITRTKLSELSAEEQLDYVEKWFLMKTKDQLKSATDIYLSVNYPKASGKGHLNDEVVYGDPKAAYRANKPFLREEDEIDEKGRRVGKKGGKTYIWEVKEALKEFSKEGEYARNQVLMNNSYDAIVKNPKTIFKLDTALTGFYFNAKQIQGIRKSIDKLNSNKDKIKAYRILQHFSTYHSQRDSKYKDGSLGDSMCNVTSESMAFEYLGKINPAPDPKMQMQDFLMVMIRDTLKQKDSKRLYVSTRIKIAKELGIKGGYAMVEEIFDKTKHKKLLEDKLNKGYGVCMSQLGHIVRVVDVNNDGIIVDDPYGRIQNMKKRRENDNSGGYSGGRNYKDNSTIKGESNLWTWKRLKLDKIQFKYYEWYYI